MALIMAQAWAPGARLASKKARLPGAGPAKGWELVVPNPELKLMAQVREVLRVKHDAIQTEQACCDWVKRQVRFHGMLSREDLFPGAEKGGAGAQRHLPAARWVRTDQDCFRLQPAGPRNINYCS